MGWTPGWGWCQLFGIASKMQNATCGKVLFLSFVSRNFSFLFSFFTTHEIWLCPPPGCWTKTIAKERFFFLIFFKVSRRDHQPVTSPLIWWIHMSWRKKCVWARREKKRKKRSSFVIPLKKEKYFDRESARQGCCPFSHYLHTHM